MEHGSPSEVTGSRKASRISKGEMPVLRLDKVWTKGRPVGWRFSLKGQLSKFPTQLIPLGPGLPICEEFLENYQCLCPPTPILEQRHIFK